MDNLLHIWILTISLLTNIVTYWNARENDIIPLYMIYKNNIRHGKLIRDTEYMTCVFVITLVAYRWQIIQKEINASMMACIALYCYYAHNINSSVRRQAITWTNGALWSITALGTNFPEIWTKVQKFPFMKMHLKMSSAKWQPICPGWEEVMLWSISHTYLIYSNDRSLEKVAIRNSKCVCACVIK